MILDLILLVISGLSFILYTDYIRDKFGMQKSISESYYRLPPKKTWLFTISLWGASIPLMVLAAYNGPNILMTLGAAFIGVVAVSPAFKSSKYENIVHYAGAIGGFGLGIISLVVEYHLFIYTAVTIFCYSILIVVLFLTNIRKNLLWIIEEVLYITILLGLLLNTILDAIG